ncbi:conserved hypothetical protein [Roseibium sp. TrichSKD4]|nr:conserved hypothetical protein [Roseibium sp. TrichSKD4]
MLHLFPRFQSKHARTSPAFCVLMENAYPGWAMCGKGFYEGDEFVCRAGQVSELDHRLP